MIRRQEIHQCEEVGLGQHRKDFGECVLTASPCIEPVVDDGYAVTSTQGPGGTGSPVITPIAPPYAVTVSPATQTDGGKPGSVVTDMVTLRNIGFKSDLDLPAFVAQAELKPVSVDKVNVPRIWTLVTCVKD